MFGSTSTVINGQVAPKPQYGVDLSGEKGRWSLQAKVATIDSWVGADSEDRVTLSYNQPLKPFSLKYQVQYKMYPGTRAGYNATGTSYQVSASKSWHGVNYGIGAEYSDADYASIRKSYGINLSLGHSFMPKLSGWLSVAHHHQFGSADYTNTNVGLYYQVTRKIGLSTSVNLYHAYASWNVDHPTLSVGLSRRL